jgi:hypothetical protein
MRRAIDLWTTMASLALVFGTLLACQKKTDTPAPAASAPVAAIVGAAPSAAPPVEAAAPSALPVAVVDAGVAAAPEIGAVKRFPDKEKVASGAVKLTQDDSKVYDEPDNSKPSVASLSKDLFVVRLASLGSDWILVDFPSGLGKLSPGWIEAKSLGVQVPAAASKAAVAQTPAAPASVKPVGSAAAVTTAVAMVPSAKPTAAATPAPARPKPGAILARPHK